MNNHVDLTRLFPTGRARTLEAAIRDGQALGYTAEETREKVVLNCRLTKSLRFVRPTPRTDDA